MSKLNSTSLTTASGSLKVCKGYCRRHLDKLGWEVFFACCLSGERNTEWKASRASEDSYLKMDSLGSRLRSAKWERKAHCLSSVLCLVLGLSVSKAVW